MPKVSVNSHAGNDAGAAKCRGEKGEKDGGERGRRGYLGLNRSA